MIMRYYGGRIGHLNNTPPQQADSLDSNSNEMDVEEDKEDDTSNDTRDGPQDIIMNDGELGTATMEVIVTTTTTTTTTARMMREVRRTAMRTRMKMRKLLAAVITTQMKRMIMAMPHLRQYKYYFAELVFIQCDLARCAMDLVMGQLWPKSQSQPGPAKRNQAKPRPSAWLLMACGPGFRS